ncbi:uncharacterized protein [Montipora capricornis]
MDTVEIPEKRRKMTTIKDADVQGTERSSSGEDHAVVHLEAKIVHQVKKEPLDQNEAGRPECSLLEGPTTENRFEEKCEKYVNEDQHGSRDRIISQNHDRGETSDVSVSEGYINEDVEGIVHQVAINHRNDNFLRRTNRQNLTERLVSERKGTKPVSHQKRRVKWAENSVRRRVNQTLPSFSLSPNISIGTRTSIVINDSSEVFKRRFRKLLKEVISKRMLMLQHSTVCNDTVAALQQKIVGLERRNKNLEDATKRLGETLTKLVREKENSKTESVSRGTQVSMGMILSRSSSCCPEKPELLSAKDKPSLNNFTDGPVIVNVFGCQRNVPSDEHTSQVAAAVESGDRSQEISASHLSQARQANILYPKIQHVCSLSTPTTESFNQQHSVPGYETYMLPKTLESTNRPVRGTNVQTTRPETSHLQWNVSQVPANQPGIFPGHVSSYLIHSGVESAHCNATVQPQHIFSSDGTAILKPVRHSAQAPRNLQTDRPTPYFRSQNAILRDAHATQNISKRYHENTPARTQSPVPVSHQGKIIPNDTVPLEKRTMFPISLPSRQLDQNLKSMSLDSWKEISSRRGRFAVQSIDQRTGQASPITSNGILSERYVDCTPDSRRYFQNVGDHNPLVGQQQVTRGSLPVQLSGNNTRIIPQGLSGPRTDPTLHLFSREQGISETQSPPNHHQICRFEEASADRNALMNPCSRANLAGSRTHIYSSRFDQTSFPQPTSSVQMLTQREQTLQPSQMPMPMHGGLKSTQVPGRENVQMASQGSGNRGTGHYQNHNGPQRHHLLLEQQQRRNEGRQPKQQAQLQQKQNQPLSLQQQEDQLWQQHLKQRRQQQQREQQFPKQLRQESMLWKQQQEQQKHHQHQPIPQWQQQHQNHQIQQQKERQLPHRCMHYQQQASYKQLPIVRNQGMPPSMSSFPDQQTVENMQHNPHVPERITGFQGTYIPGHLRHDQNDSSAKASVIFQDRSLENLLNLNSVPSETLPGTNHRLNAVEKRASEGPLSGMNFIQAVGGQKEGTNSHFPTSKGTPAIIKETISAISSSTTRSIPNDILEFSARDNLPHVQVIESDNISSDTKTFTSSKPPDNEPYSALAFAPEAPTSCSEKENQSLSVQPLKSISLRLFCPQQKMENEQSDKRRTACSAVTTTEAEERVGRSTSSFTEDTSSKDSHTDDPHAESSQADQKEKASQVETNEKMLSLKPALSIEQSKMNIVISWDLPNRELECNVIKYELFVLSASSQTDPSSSWDLLGVVDALALPMACSMNQVQAGASYYFTVRAITEKYERGLFSDPCFVTVSENEQIV